MVEPLLKIEYPQPVSEDKRMIEEKIKSTHTDELILGLCGPIGTDIHFVADAIKNILEEKYNYRCVSIKLSDLIRRHSPALSFDPTKEDKFSYYNKLIDAGNDLRDRYGLSILAELAINEIAVNREMDRTSEADPFESMRICYIIDSIKNEKELELLRLVYRDIFYFIGVFSNLDIRIKNLENKGIKTGEVFELIDRDSGEDAKHGQKVTKTFVDADFFLRVDSSSSTVIEPKLGRYFNLIFASDIITPTPNETAMYLASAAAGNSACLSRQVGASITDKFGEVIAVGWNDVPKVKGGVYQTDPEDVSLLKDKRCYNLNGGVCFNDSEKNMISELLLSELIKRNLIDEAKKDDILMLIKNSRIKELIEFSRAVHAEMLAIILASQKGGARIIEGKLFCTTYPCHNCARHIIASGIKEVYYIEPYRKSLATKLHEDAITEDESKTDLVRILMYDGVSPKRYLEFFRMIPDSRKRHGKKINLKKKIVSPKNTLSLQAIPILEKHITEDLKNKKIIVAE
jgi:deoxycytidylate deaminase